MPDMNQNSPIILWFRDDLRLSDHPALSAAAKLGVPIIPLFILDDLSSDARRRGGAARWWLQASLESLGREVQALGGRVILRRGRAPSVLEDFAKATKAQGVFFTRLYEPSRVEEEQDVAAMCRMQGITCRRYPGALLFEPEDIATQKGEPFRVFTPFSKACLSRGGIKAPLSVPDNIIWPDSWPETDPLSSWGLYRGSPDWAKDFPTYWTPGSAGASQKAERFVVGPVSDYSDKRDIPSLDFTSSLSPHLSFGEISPRQVWHRVHHQEGAEGRGVGSQAFLRQILWREFCRHLLFHWPQMTAKPFDPKFDAFPWREDDGDLLAWQKGQTGYPLVDAGMRQLWHSGWMHNRVRMVVASFLTKHLMISWRAGAEWFWDTLVDADLANNTAGWQWVAGCGCDAAPYFRVFNPILQSRKFDPEGFYIRRWVPELAPLSNRQVHAPWEDGVLPPDYPAPIVDHAAARARALDAYNGIRQRSN
ncbi:MAG: deoxyribodipyrimidine photo-lyase [Pseudomonadota bacterium]